eukprot:COSAG01_NODE_1289_length_10885_cov_3.769331_8_plen_95_part_00
MELLRVRSYEGTELRSYGILILQPRAGSDIAGARARATITARPNPPRSPRSQRDRSLSTAHRPRATTSERMKMRCNPSDEGLTINHPMVNKDFN